MKTKIEAVSGVKKKITVDLPVERVATAIEKAFTKVQRKAVLKGFREGKVPKNMVELHFKDSIEDEAIEHLIQNSYVEALKAEAIYPISRPSIVPGPFAKDAPFSYTAEFEVHPEVEAKHYDSLTLEKTEREITGELIDKRLEAIRQSMAQLEPALEGSSLDKGKVAFIDFKGTADGKEFNGSKADNFLLEFGSGALISQFEDTLVGMKSGEAKTVEFDYPKDYFNKELAGKHGVFDVIVKELKIKKLPELNDDFAKDLGQFKTLAEVKEDIKKRMDSAVEYESKNELINGAMEILVEKHKFDIPESMVAQELKNMFEDFVKRLSAQGKKFEDTGIKVEMFIEQYKPLAEKKVKGYYILDAIAKAEKIEVSDADVDDRLKKMSENINQPLEKVLEYYKTNELMDGLKYQLLHEKTLDFVVSKAKIKSKKPKKDKK